MGHLAKFVDSIAASPTVRLDLNDETTWTCARFDPGVPTIRRAMSSNTMTDGIHVSSSSYDARTITFELLLRTSTQDLNATQIQTLARELDRATNIVMYQPNGLTKPVFFKTFRSNLSQIQDILTSTAMRTCTIELLAEPFALGLMETVSVGTVNNDPAHATNGCYFDIAAASVIGDVATPCLIVDTVAATSSGIWGVRQHGTPSDGVYFYQAESAAVTDTNPGGGPSATNSGTGTNNFRRASGSAGGSRWDITGTDAQRLARAGDYRILLIADAGANWTARGYIHREYDRDGENVYGQEVDVPLGRCVTDLGVFSLGSAERPAGSGSVAPPESVSIHVELNRSSGAAVIDTDYIQLVPADEACAYWQIGRDADAVTYDHAFDSALESAYRIETAGTLPTGTANKGVDGEVSGGFIELVPNQVNRVIWVRFGDLDTGDRTIVKTDTSSLTVYYFPRYIFIRPSAT